MTEEILIVDDEPDIRTMLKILMETEGYAVRTSSNGREAIQSFTSRPCDVVLTDIKMPGMTGLELLRRIKAIDKNVEVIVLTGHGSIENAVEAMKNGEAFDFIQKPLKDVDLLVASVERAAERRSLRLKNEAMLQELRKLSSAVEHSPSMLAITDRSGRVAYVNPKFAELTGYAPSECLGRSPSLLKSGFHDNGFYQRLWKTIMSGEEWRGEFRNRKKSGDLYWESASISPIRDEAGEITHFVKVSEDITERKQADEALRESERFNTAILNSLTYPILILDDKGRIVKANTAWREFFEEKRRMLPTDVGFENYLDCCMMSLQSVEGQDEAFAREVVAGIRGVIRGDCDRFETQVQCGGPTDVHWYMMQVHRLDMDASLTLVCQIDITLLKRVEEHMLHHRKMEAVATLAGGIAHEFNNALAGVSGNVDLLEMKAGDIDGIDRHLTGIRRSTQRMHDLSQRLLAYAKGKDRHPESLTLASWLQKATASLRREIPKEVALNIHVHPQDLTAKIDFLQLQIVMSELIKNAAEAIHGPGAIEVNIIGIQVHDANNAEAAGLAPGAYIRIVVTDTGQGMDEVCRRRIYEPFFSTRFIGRGVGMAVVYGIVRGLGGDIDVRSAPGQGVQVAIHIPSGPQAVAGTSEERKGRHDRGERGRSIYGW